MCSARGVIQETTFITGSTDGFRVRIFTPEQEIPFAGHPVLGTAYVIATEFPEASKEAVRICLDAGVFDISIEYSSNIPELLHFRHNPPEFGEEVDMESVTRALGLPRESIVSELPVQVLSTGLPFIMIPVLDMDSLASIKVNISEYQALIARLPAKALYAFTLLPKHADTRVRMFAPAFGIPEDPATGSGAGCLAAYLLKNKLVSESEFPIMAEQGIEMGRESLLRLDAGYEHGTIAVSVGGSVVPTAKGKII